MLEEKTRIFEEKESEVRSYCRSFPVEFSHAKNGELITVEGEHYIDFFAGAGAINYGHNNPEIKKAILDYLSEDRIIHALDMYTEAKKTFLETFNSIILKEKNLDYKVMFCGSTGTNAVEAALKLARKNKKRNNIFAFSGAFHGMSLGSLAMTSDSFSRNGAGVPLNNVTFMPYYNAFEKPQQSIDYLDWILSDSHSGVDKPAAVFLETLQAEGGINPAPVEWLKKLRELCTKHDILMIVDEIQVGVCRTGGFFSFERAGIVPDMVVLSKSISGFGLPMSLLLLKPELDIFKPAEHNGTFRGNQLGFVGATAGVNYYKKYNMPLMVKEREKIIADFLTNEILTIDPRLKIRGMGMIWGIDFTDIDCSLSKTAQTKCVENKLIVERCGRKDCVLKIMPPLTIDIDMLKQGLDIIKKSIQDILK